MFQDKTIFMGQKARWSDPITTPGKELLIVAELYTLSLPSIPSIWSGCNDVDKSTERGGESQEVFGGLSGAQNGPKNAISTYVSW
jgi:hypothetical protein